MGREALTLLPELLVPIRYLEMTNRAILCTLLWAASIQMVLCCAETESRGCDIVRFPLELDSPARVGPWYSALTIQQLNTLRIKAHLHMRE
jgi:hypothetical protein